MGNAILALAQDFECCKPATSTINPSKWVRCLSIRSLCNDVTNIALAPKKGKKISLNEFLGDNGKQRISHFGQCIHLSSAFGSWADEMEDLPTARTFRIAKALLDPKIKSFNQRPQERMVINHEHMNVSLKKRTLSEVGFPYKR